MSIAYRYFERPHAFSTYREEPQRCEICGQERPGYRGPFYGPNDLEFVCEECLSTGKLETLKVSTNNGDFGALLGQLKAMHLEMSDLECDALARARTAELERRTPHIVAWQDWLWPAHCGDYCRYVKEVGQPEIARLASDGDGLAFFATHANDIADLGHARDVWEGIRPDEQENGAVAYSVGVYLFRCMTCAETILIWDCD